MQIAMKTNSMTSGFMPVLGTDCSTLEEQERYVAHFGKELQLVADDFDFGQAIPEKDRVRKSSLNLDPSKVNKKAVAEIVKMLEKAIRK